MSSSPTKEDIEAKLKKQESKIKVLQQKLRRKNKSISTSKDIISQLKDKQIINEQPAVQLQDAFSGLSLEVIKNHFLNRNRSTKGYRHNEDAKKFALTLHFYSPRAYEYVRSVFALPHPSSLANWSSTVNCEPGFLRTRLIT